MPRIAFIIPYFGKFNPYFQLYLNSCRFNGDLCDWLIFTDDHTPYDYPENVKIYYRRFEDIQHLIKSRFDFDISLDRPYKLCDYKCAYGLIFEEYISGYSHWGHCDADLIWGRIRDFITDDLLKGYDKLFDLGHCTIYRNTKKINEAFMLPLKGVFRYRSVFGNSENHSFDEEYNDSINTIFLEHGFTVFTGSYAANIYTKSSDFRLTMMSGDKRSYVVEKKVKGFFVWDHGRLIRYVKSNNGLQETDYLYIHMQSRHMENKLNSYETTRYKIIPNTFEPIEFASINDATFNKIKRKHWNLHYLRHRSENLMIKIKRSVLYLRRQNDQHYYTGL